MSCFFRKTLFSYCLLFSSSIFAQEKRYIMLDMLDSLGQVNRYTLNTMELYGVDETIELYNVDAYGLVLFSVLPDFSADSNWTEVDLATIQSELVDPQTYRRMVIDRVFSMHGLDKKSLRFVLVKQEDGRFLKSNVCLAEFFRPDHYSPVFNIPFGTINILQDTLSIKRMEAIYRKGLDIPDQYGFPLDVRRGQTIMANRYLLEREYMSRVFELADSTAYQFWTFTDWSGQDTYVFNRGIDRFVYIPDKGIVGGSYDFYFLYFDSWTSPPKDRKRHTKTIEELWENVLEERVMIAEEMK